MTIPFQSVGLLPDGSQPGPIGASPADEAQAAPFPYENSEPGVSWNEAYAFELRGKSSQRAASLAGKDTSLAGLPASFVSDDPCLSAQRAMGIC